MSSAFAWARSLRGRLVLAVAGVHALLMSLFVWDMTHRQERLLEQQQADLAEAVAHSMAASSGGWLSSHDASGLQEIVDAQRGYPELRYAMLVDEDGRVLAHTDARRLGQFVRDLPNAGAAGRTRRGPDLLDVTVPSRVDGRVVGWVRVGFGREGVRARLAGLLRAAVAYTLAAILAGVVLALLLANGVTARLYAIRRTSAAVRAGRPDQRVPDLGDDEVAQLGRDFNDMLDALGRREAERRAAEEALRDSERLARATFDLAAVGIAHVAPDGRWLRVNPRLAEMLGTTAERLLDGGDYQRVTHPGDVARDVAVAKRCLDGELESFTHEKRYVTPAGEVVWALLSSVLVRRPDGTPDYFISMIQEIGDRKRAEQALRESERRVRLLLDSTAEGLFGLDERGACTFVNRAGLKLLGREREEDLLGRDLHALLHPRREGEPACTAATCPIAGAPESGSGLHAEHGLFHRADGTTFPVELWAYPMRSEGRTVGVVATFTDITERLRVRAERQSLEAQLRQSQKMEAVGQLAGGIAHDFNNILTVILGNTNLVRAQGPLGPEREKWLAEIQAAGRRAASLTQRLLTFSRRQRFECRDLDLNQVVAGMQGMLGRLLGEDITFRVVLAPEPLPVSADAGMLEQVLMNLAVNARDALAPGGRFTIATHAASFGPGDAGTGRRARPGSAVVLTVSDTGCGIPPEHLDHVFEPFFTTKDVGRGTGLGLSIVSGIVEQHGGWIEVESEPGRGTTFRIHLPRGAGAPDGGADHGPGPAAAARGGGGVLLTEDDDAVRRLARAALESGGYRVVEAADGPSALRAWSANRDRIRMAVLDMVMPGGMSGAQLAERLREEAPELPILFCSGYSPEGGEAGIAPITRSAFLGKPYELARLLAEVRQLIEG